jgi:8-oxo-dGTP pyrophosphatase MutT (NUDIX family)
MKHINITEALSVEEDVESDLTDSTFLTNLVMQMDTYLLGQLKNPTYDADRMSVKFGPAGQHGIRMYGDQFGWPGVFGEIMVIMLPDDGSRDVGSFRVYKDGELLVVTFRVLPDQPTVYPEDNEIVQGMKNLTTDKWHSTILHELKHVQQYIRKQIGTKTSTMRMGNKEYYNNPTEFDAHYHQFTRSYYTILDKLRNKPEVGLRMLNTIDFDRDFKVAVEHMLPNTIDKEAWGIWFYAKDKQHRSLVKRLYALHQAIVKELVKMDKDKEGVYENDDADHQASLDATGYFGEAGAGCIIMAADTKRILLPLRSGYVQEPNTYGTWGGAIDRGEDVKTAVMREVDEEAGYTGDVIGMEHLYRFQDKEFRYDTFVVVVPTEFEPTLNWETESAVWVEFGNWPTPLHFGLVSVFKDASAMNKLGMLVSE